MTTAPKGLILAVNSKEMLIRASSGVHFRLPLQEGLAQGDDVWMYFQEGRSLVAVEKVETLDPDEQEPAELEADEAFDWDLGELDTGE